jgi:hypothetical protein
MRALCLVRKNPFQGKPWSRPPGVSSRQVACEAPSSLSDRLPIEPLYPPVDRGVLGEISDISLALRHSTTPHHVWSPGNGSYLPTSSPSISAAAWNCWSSPVFTNQRAAAWALAGFERIARRSSERTSRTRACLVSSCLGQLNKTCLTVCSCQPQGQCGLTPRHLHPR